jgi:hypothetical protein
MQMNEQISNRGYDFILFFFKYFVYKVYFLYAEIGDFLSKNQYWKPNNWKQTEA